MYIQDWFPLGFTGWISLQSRGLSRVFFNATVQKHQFFSSQPFLWSNSHMHTWPLENPELVGVFNPCRSFWKCGPWISSISITWELVRNAKSRPTRSAESQAHRGAQLSEVWSALRLTLPHARVREPLHSHVALPLIFLDVSASLTGAYCPYPVSSPYWQPLVCSVYLWICFFVTFTILLHSLDSMYEWYHILFICLSLFDLLHLA